MLSWSSSQEMRQPLDELLQLLMHTKKLECRRIRVNNTSTGEKAVQLCNIKVYFEVHLELHFFLNYMRVQ